MAIDLPTEAEMLASNWLLPHLKLYIEAMLQELYPILRSSVTIEHSVSVTEFGQSHGRMVIRLPRGYRIVLGQSCVPGSYIYMTYESDKMSESHSASPPRILKEIANEFNKISYDEWYVMRYSCTA